MCFRSYYSVAECPNVCDCKWKDGKESVMCINTNLTTIPENLDAGIQVLHFIGNSLITLKNDAFESAGLPNLQKLHLVKCNIKFIDRYAFRTLTNLVVLDLSYNVLTIVPSLAFAPIPDLRELKLNGNPILKIGSYAFTHVHQLERLEIAECRIGYIDEKAFNGLENTLELLKLNKNRLVNVKSETFIIMEALQDFDLTDNPLNCSCMIRTLKNWVLSRGISQRKMPSCAHPQHNVNKSWEKLQENDFACLPSIYAPIKIVTAYEGDNVTLTCRIGGTPSPNVKWTLRNRVLLNSTFGYPVMNKRSYLVHPVLDNFSNLTILELEMQETGEYVCVAENKAGKVIADIVLILEKPPIKTILSERVVLIGILVTAVVIIFLCSIILFIRVMYCKHDTQADIESKRRIISEKIEMKRNSANMKRSSSILPNAKSEKVYKSSSDVNNSEQKKEKYPLNSISEGDGPKPVRPNCLNDMKLKTDTIDSNPSPNSSMFESHIGEMALQHHVLHKKELPTGKLYTTAMAFMTDDVMMDYQNEASVGKMMHYNTIPRNYTSNNRDRVGRNLQDYPRISESQSPLLKNKYYGSSSESVNFASERTSKDEYSQQYSSYRKSATPSTVRKSKDGYWVYPSLPSSPDKNKYWMDSSYNSTKETPLLNNIYRKSKNSHVNYSTYTSDTRASVEPKLATATYDYHAAQLERFLDEYRRLHSELTKMKDTCDKLSREDEIVDSMLSSRNYFGRDCMSRMSLTDTPFDSGSFERRFSSRSSLHRPLSSKSRSFDRPLQSKSCSFERSVSFVPTLKDTSVKTATSDDVIMPKSILKKKNEPHYYDYGRKSYRQDGRFHSSTLPLKRTRLRRFSDSSTNGFFD